jgi:hypothetical protein
MTHPSCTFRIYVSVMIRFCTKSLKYSTVAPGLLPPPTSGINGVCPSAYKLCASHSRTVAATAAADAGPPSATKVDCCWCREENCGFEGVEVPDVLGVGRALVGAVDVLPWGGK